MHEFPVYLTTWLTQYGSFALFALLALGILALPVPDETLIVFAGILISQQKLYLTPTLFAAYLGTICGITVSYSIGRLAGIYLLHKHGRWFGVTEAKLIKVHNWFEHYGTWLLFFGYFLPGIRHLTGYAAGMTELSYKRFAIFAYCGAVVWASIFLLIGYYLGNRWFDIYSVLSHYWDYAIVIVAVLIVIYIIYHFRKTKPR
jgi:membrane protein DedA with SNARE-associated domain